jgi:hypothetical protein
MANNILKKKIRKWLELDEELAVQKRSLHLLQELRGEIMALKEDMLEYREVKVELDELSKWIQKKMQTKANARSVSGLVKEYADEIYDKLKEEARVKRLGNMQDMSEVIVGQVNEVLQKHLIHHHKKIYDETKKV